MRVHRLSIFTPEPVAGGRRVRYGGGNRSGAAGRRRSRPRGAEGGGQGEGRARMPEPGDVPPAVVSLLARRLERLGSGATLVDLASRGWFQVRTPAGLPGSAGPMGPAEPGGPALCVVPAETPGGPLTPFERR